MKKRIIGVLVAGLLLIPGVVMAKGAKCVRAPEVKKFRNEQKKERKEFIHAQREENREFRKTLKDMTPQEKAEAVISRWKNQYQKRREFGEKMYEENIARLKDRLENNEKLTEVQKEELANFLKEQHAENIAFHDQQYKENSEFFKNTLSNPNLTEEARKEAVRAHRLIQKKENKEYYKAQRKERREVLKKIHSEIKGPEEKNS